MSKANVIKAEPRTDKGTQATRRCRRSGMLPGIVYGHKKEAVSVSVPADEFLQTLRHGYLFELQMPDHSETVLVKEIQYDYLNTTPIHVDFSRVDLNERVTVNVPLVLRGTPAGATSGGVLQQLIKEVPIECLVTDIPEQIRANVAKLELNQQLHASDVTVPEGMKLMLDPSAVLAVVSVITEEEVAPAAVPGAEASAEPEVIAKGKEKVEGEEGAEGEAEKKA